MRKLGVLALGLALSVSVDTTSVLAESAMIKADGSSTVYPITEAVAEEFGSANKDVKVTVGISGTGGGFKKFCAGETDISDASRPIKEAELKLCKENGVEFIELPVAFDALTVVINPKNTWAKTITVAELKKVWEPDAQGKVMKWSDIRSDWPDKPLKLFGAGTDSGTFDYFTEAVVGKEKASRSDYTASEDDNVLVQGVSSEIGGLGYFGYAYFKENAKKLVAASIDNGFGAIAPAAETVISGKYKPLSRPLFIYVSVKSLGRPEVLKFTEFYLKNVHSLLGEVGYVPLPDKTYDLASKRLAARKSGSVFASGVSQVGMTLEELLAKEAN